MLFAMLAVGMTGSTIGAIKLNLYSRKASEAMALVEQRLEEFRAMTGSEIYELLPADQDSVGPETEVVFDSAGNEITDGSSGYTRQWSLERVNGSYTMYQAKVKVTWDSPETHSVENVAYFCASSSC